MNELVSVIIPVYNNDKYLKDAIESVLSQTYKTIEIIVVDDGSTDKSGVIAKEFFHDVNYTYQSNSGACSARNKGVDMAKGKFIAFLDSDDLWLKNKIEIQLLSYYDKPEFDFNFGLAQQFLSPELEHELKNKINFIKEPLPAVCPSSFFIEKTKFLKVGYFNLNIKLGEFIDWVFRAKEKDMVYNVIPDVVLRRRIHSSNTNNLDTPFRNKEYLRVIRENLKKKKPNQNEQ